jgi:CMP-N,N'-diacetyllegionaminic acid synthase
VRILGLIPARGGSKGVPGKNTRPLAGRSLTARAIDCARASGVVDRIVVSTDDPAAAAIARDNGVDVPFMRPAHLATDFTPMFEVITHALEELARAGYRPDALLLLQPTSPFREPRHITRAATLLANNDSVCSVIPLDPTHNPYSVMRIREDGALDFFLEEGRRYTRRQDMPPAYVREGTIYLARIATIEQQRSLYGALCKPMILTPEESLSIDTLEDWNLAEARLSSRAPA